MAINFLPINPVTINPRNAMLDTTDLNRSIAGYRQGQDQAFDFQTNQLIGDSLAKGDWTGAQAAAAKRGDIATNLQLRTAKAAEDQANATKERLDMEREKAVAQKFAAVGQAFDKEPDEAKATAQLQSLYQRDPRVFDAVKKNLPPELHNDPRAVSRYFQAIARGYVDPQDEKLKTATIAGKEAEADLHRAQAAQARQKPTDIQNLAPNHQLYQVVQDPDGTKRAVFIGGQQQGAVDPNVQAQITGGLKYLGTLPAQYGGDAGSFGSAVGPLQGSDSSINPAVIAAKAVGNAYNTVRNWGWSGSEAWPSEVQRAIKGGTDTLSAIIKPLIRKPGEGSWSDADQAKLDSIVGELKKSNDVEGYFRELGNVRKRINANFQINLPPVPGEKEAPAAGSGAALAKPIETMSIGELARLPNDLSDDQLMAASARLKALREGSKRSPSAIAR